MVSCKNKDTTYAVDLASCTALALFRNHASMDKEAMNTCMHTKEHY